MILLGDVILSEDIFKRKFACQLDACKGACCVQGDRGAPLEEEEIPAIAAHLDKILPLLPEENRDALLQQGIAVEDKDGDLCTTLRPSDNACNFTYFENGLALCAIEKAYKAGDIPVNKPISCHLYPIRVKKFKEMVGLNYNQWDICNPACKAGEELNIPVFEFLKEALVRRFGEDFFKELQQVAKDLEASGK